MGTPRQTRGRDAAPAPRLPVRRNCDRLLYLRLALEELEGRAAPAVFTVTTTADSGAGSLRQAIQAANLTADPDEVRFAIPGAGVQTITPLTPLPNVTQPLALLADTQPGFAGTPLVELRGDAAGAGANGLVVAAPDSAVRGFAVNRFANIGVWLAGTGTAGVLVAGNWVGLTPAGAAAPNKLGVVVAGGADNNRVGGTTPADRNVISGNALDGVWVADPGTAGNSILGNHIGTNPAGTAAVPNARYGVLVFSGATGTKVGGPAAGAGNLISGNAANGVQVAGPTTTGTVVQGNRIGTDVSGSAAVPNGLAGASNSEFDAVFVIAPGTTVGGLTDAPGTGAGNLISGNSKGYGVRTSADGATIAGNLIGLAADGTTPVPNAGGIVGQGNSGLVGGPDPRARNVVSGNAGLGVYLDTGADWQVLNNSVGLDRSGTTARGNGGSGVVLYAMSNLRLGAPGAGNVVAASDGLSFFGYGSNWTVQGNRFGTDAAGNTPLPSARASGLIYLSTNLTLGGTNPGEGNQFAETLQVTSTTGGTALGNTFGLNAAGTAVLPGTAGQLALGTGTTGFAVGDGTAAGRNVFASALGGGYAGVAVQGFGTVGNTVRGNYFGTNKAGTAAVGTASYGVNVSTSAAGTVVDRNVVATASAAGVLIDGGGLPDGTVGFFRGNGNLLNGGPGGTGVAVGPVGFGPGLAGTQALSFDRATPGYVRSETTAYTLSAANVSVAGWVNLLALPAVGAEHLIAANDDPAAPNYALSVVGITDAPTAMELRFRYRTTTGIRIAAVGVNLPLNAFRHVAVTADGTTIRFYVGGVPVGSVAVAGTPTVNYNPVPGDPTIQLNVGGGPGVTNRTFGGLLEDVTVTGRALSAAELARFVALGGDTLGGSWTRDTTVTGNLIGLLPDGVTPGNVTGDGVRVVDSETNTVGGATALARNVIGRAGGSGVAVTGRFATGNVIAGNHIGVDAAGAAKLANANGVVLAGGAAGNLVGTDGDGSNDAAEGNLISGNTQYGVLISGADANRVAGNRIGLNASGTLAVPNLDAVAVFGGTGNVIGTDGSADAFNANERNVISGNTDRGIILDGANVAAGNWIGLRPDGTALGNKFGVQVTGTGARVGTDADGVGDAAERNVIAGNTLSGVIVRNATTTGAVIAGNSIGTDPTGSLARPNATGIEVVFGANANTIGGAAAGAGNLISGNAGVGIDISTAGNSVLGNLIGLGADGSTVVANAGAGVRLSGADGPTANTIGSAAGRNVISGNGGDGVLFSGLSAGGNTVQGNYIGTDRSGTADRGNAGAGVRVAGGGDDNLIGGFTASPGTGVGNVIAGNGKYGVAVEFAGTTGTLIRGNLIGLGADGATVVGNTLSGVYLAGVSGTVVGGDDAADGAADGLVQARNVISGNAQHGVQVVGDGATRATGNTIAGNLVGTDRIGAADKGNALSGVAFTDRASGNTVGGATAGAGNVISGNDASGVLLESANVFANVVAGNRIGTDPTGTAKLGNAFRGVNVVGASGNRIGTDGDGVNDLQERNVIANSGFDAVAFVAASNNRLAGNYLGTDVTGTLDFGQFRHGVLLSDGASGNVIGTDGDGSAGDAAEGNLITGTDNGGGANITITGLGSDNNVVAGNRIGTNAAGTATFGTPTNVNIQGGARNNRIGTDGDGVSDLLERNLISGASLGSGVGIQGAGTTGNRVAGNFIGTDVTGNGDLGNGSRGVNIGFGASGNVIGTDGDGSPGDAAEGNVISGNGQDGVAVTGDGNAVAGNLIGLGADGTTLLPNGGAFNGVTVFGGAGNRIGTNADGTSDALERNVVAGHTGGRGVQLQGATTGTVVAGNYIGTDKTGTLARPNGFAGVSVAAGVTNTVIGGTVPAARNVISGNAVHGVEVTGAGATGTVIQGNYIGLTAAGIAELGNGGSGVVIATGATGTVVGGFTPSPGTGAGNVISGNAGGGVLVAVAATDTAVRGNLIGLGVDGTTKIGNGSDGVRVNGLNTLVGGDDAADGAADGAVQARNVISGNAGIGVNIGTSGSERNTVVRGNFIGTDRAGASAAGNSLGGVVVGSAPGTRIGGDTPGAGNIISGNGSSGVSVVGISYPVIDGRYNAVVQGNRIGTNAAGTAALPNPIGVAVSTAGTLIADNLISGNSTVGVSVGGVAATGTVVAGNRIGTDAAGATAVPNGGGVRIDAGATGNTVGGLTPSPGTGTGNVISGNAGVGVVVTGAGTTSNAILGNLIGTNAAGTAAVANASGVFLQSGANNNTVGGGAAGARNVVSGNASFGVLVNAVTGTRVQGNFVGTDAAGLLDLGNGGVGVSLSNVANANLVGTDGDGTNDAAEGNVIAGNTDRGVFVNGSNNVIAGNLIGLGADGVTPLGNSSVGIQMLGAAGAGSSGNRIGTDGNGVSDGLERNVISSNTLYGIQLAGDGVTNNLIAGNYIGTDKSGTLDRGNLLTGVIVHVGAADNNTIGGTGPNTGNVISGNDQGGVAVSTTGNVVLGNVIGLTAAGTAALPNQLVGVAVSGTSNTVGGTAAGARNVISGNDGDGVQVSGTGATGNRVEGNLIGTDITGGAAIGNAGVGVKLSAGAVSTTVGGTAAGAGNTVAFNAGAGVLITGVATVGNTLQGNRLFANAGGSVVLADGGNRGQPAPVLTGAVITGTETRVQGTLTAAPGEQFRIEVVAAPTAGEARTVLGSAVVTTGAGGGAAFDIGLPAAPLGSRVSALATRLGTGDTSALSGSQGTAGAVILGLPASVPEGTPVTLTAFAGIDPGVGQSLAYNWLVTKNGVPFAASYEASITFTPDDEGSYAVRLTVTGTGGGSATTGPLPFTVTNVRPAVQVFGAPAEPVAGTPLALRAEANDPGAADALTYAWQVRRGDAAGPVLATGTGADFTYTPPAGGLYYLAVTVADGDGGTDTRALSLVAVGGPPLAAIDVPATADEGTPVRALAAVGDLVRTDLRYAWQVLKAGVAYPFVAADRGAITFTPDDDGPYTVRLTVTSGGVAYPAAATVVTVRNANPEAEIALPAGTGPSVPAGVPLTLTGLARDRGTADVPSYRWEVIGPAPVPGGTGRQFTFAPPAAGEYVVRLTVRDDDGGVAVAVRDLRVTAAGFAVAVTGAPATAAEGALLSLGSTVTGVSGPLRYDWAVTKNGDPFLTLSSGGFVPAPLPLALRPDDEGSYVVTLTVTAPDGRVGADTRRIAVTNVGPTAAITGGDGPLDEGSPVTLTAAATDPGAADALAYEWRVDGVVRRPDPQTPTRLVFTPPNDGTYTVTLTVRDDRGAAAVASKTLAVRNVLPRLTIATTDAGTVPDGSTLGLSARVSDPGAGDTLTYAWTAARNGTAVQTGTGPAFVLNRSVVGVYVVTLAVGDGAGTATTSTLVLAAGPAGGLLSITPATLAGLTVNQLVVRGLGGNDAIVVDPAVTVPVVLDGAGGDDSLVGGSGSDLLIAGPGNNTLAGGLGDDTLQGGGNDDLRGGLGGDRYRVHFSAVRLFETGAGTDVIDLSGVTRGVTFDLSVQDGTPQPVFPGTGDPSTLAATGPFEQVVGSAFGDKLRTGVDASTLFGGDGDDTLAVAGGTGVTVFGGEGLDSVEVLGGSAVTVFGGAGDDTLAVGGGSEVTVFGEDGADSLAVLGGSEVTVFGGDGDDSIAVGGGADVTVFGGDGRDRLAVTGGTGVLVLGGSGRAAGGGVTQFGGDGADSLAVLGGTDVTVFGGDGGDTVAVSGTADGVTVFGGDGADSLAVLGGSEVTVFGEDGSDSVAVGGGVGVTVFGGVGDDTVAVGGGSDVTVYGADGDDSLAVLGGTGVTVFGSEGDDAVAVTGGTEVTVFGADGADSVVVLAGSEVTVFGEAGADTLAVLGGSDVTVFGGDGDDTIAVGGPADGVTVFGGDGADSLAVLGGTDVTVFGGVGDDSVAVTGGTAVTVFGADGDDTLAVGGGTGVTVFGNADDDSVAVTGGTGVTVFGGDGDDRVAVGGPAAGVTVFGGDGDDTLTVAGGTAVTVFGGVGDDSIAVGGGSDVTVFGEAGADTIAVLGGTDVTVFGGAEDDSVAVAGGTNVTVFGAAGDDTIAVGGGTAVTVFGGDGDDSVGVGGSAAGVTVFGGEGDDSVAVAGGTAVTVFGADGDDTLSVTGGTAVTVFGGDGDDSISVAGGTGVTVFGNADDDTIAVGGGTAVTVFGGDGDDTVAVLATAGGATVFGNEGDDSVSVAGGTSVTVFGDAGDDTIAVTGGTTVTVFGGDGADSLSVAGGTAVTAVGDAGADAMAASGGTDITLFGGDGGDALTVTGGTNVTAFGGLGDDTLVSAGGGATGVKLYGEAGDDALTVSAGTAVTAGGGSGDDALLATGGDGVILLGDSGADALTVAGAAAVTLSGGRGDDTLAADRAVEVLLFGDDGNDLYRFAAGGQTVRVKEILVLDPTNFEAPLVAPGDPAKAAPADARGSDTLDLSAYPRASVDLGVFGSEGDPAAGAQVVTAGFTLFVFGRFENVVGTPGDDVLVGNAADNRLAGGGGNDRLDGLAGADTLEGSAGNDTLAGGGGGDAYVFGAGPLGADAVAEAAGVDADALDFTALDAPLALDLGLTGPQAFGAALTLTLSDGAGIEAVTGTRFADRIRGNVRDNTLEGGPGDDTLAGAAGDDLYVFAGTGLGADRVEEAPDADSDTLDFARLDAPLALDLASTAAQPFGAALTLTLADAAGVENAVGTGFADAILGNARANRLTGAGGADRLDGRAGNDVLQAGYPQVVLLDFDTATRPLAGDHVYTPAERAAVLARLRAVFAPFDYVFTADPAEAAARTRFTGRAFATVVLNDGPGGGIGGEANELDFRNLARTTRVTVNINQLLGGAGQPADTSENVVLLTSTVIAHELGHLAGLRHADAFGPIGSGIFAGVDPAGYLPVFAGPRAATETPRHIMASPLSVGTTLADATAPTFFGEREAIKLAFAETGEARRERATAPGSHATFAAAEPLGVLPGLSVPNTLAAGSANFGRGFDVSALAVVGEIALAAGRSEDDVYSFVGRAGDLMNLEVVSASARPLRANPIDGVLKLYDSAGTLLAESDDEFETADPTLIDVRLPADGVYYVAVDTFAAAFDLDVGRYELFLSRFATTTGTPAANLGDTLLGGAGDDTVTGGPADDTVRSDGVTAADRDVYAGRAGFDTLDLTALPTAVYTADGFELVVGLAANRPPTLAAVAPVRVPQGPTAITVTPSAADPDLPADRLTFTLAPTGAAGDVFPAGASVDPRSGIVTVLPARPGVYAATLTVADAAGLTASQRVVITVDNVAPTVTVGDPATLAEGDTLTRAGSFADPGADTWTATVDYGDGGGAQPLALRPDKTFALGHRYLDDGAFTVTVRVTDGTDTRAASFPVTVTGVAPAGTLLVAGPVSEGGTATASLSAVTDPSPTDTAAGFRYSFARTQAGLAGSYAAAPAAASASLAFPASGPATVYARVFDADGAYRDYQTVVAVLNVAPTVTGVTTSPGTAVTEGTPLTFAGAVADPGNDVAAGGLSWSVVASTGQVIPDGAGPTFGFTPADNGTYTALFKATDADGAVAVRTVQVTVANVPPVAGVTGPAALGLGRTGTFTLTATDPGPADRDAGFAFRVDWGDGTPVQTVRGPSGVQVPHAFAAPGTFTIRVTAADKDGGTGPVATLAVRVDPVFVADGDLYVFGTPGNDTIAVTAASGGVRPVVNGVAAGPFFPTGKVKLFALAGNDSVTVDSAVNRPTELHGQEGNDTLRGGSRADRLDGGAGNDSLVASPGGDTLLGGDGDDTLSAANSGPAVLDGGAGDDRLTAENGSFTLFGGAGRDRLWVRNGDMRVDAGSGNDTVDAANGNSVLLAGAGDDSVVAGNGNLLIDAGDGADTVRATNGNVTIFGGTGDDSLVAANGNDLIDAGAGNDTVEAANGNHTVLGGAGDDRVTVAFGNTRVDAGDGSDIVTGGSGNLTLLGGGGDDSLTGGAGNDLLDGGAGFGDTLVGGGGNDTLTDPDGVARAAGGSGNDDLSLTFAAGWVLYGVPVLPAGAVTGGDGNDRIRVAVQNAQAQLTVGADAGNDRVELTGTWGKAWVFGGAGWDTVRAAGAGDLLLDGVEVREP